ncbi:MAG: nucleotide sugar dehydrogenase [Methylococcaceae bacterium]
MDSVGIIGLGYVGLPLALRFAEAGMSVTGFDIDTVKVNTLNHGKSYIRHIGDEAIRNGKENGFHATNDLMQIQLLDAIILCVPTPLNTYREPDLSYVLNTVDSITPYLQAGQLVALESTTYPGTTEEELRPRLESSGYTVGKDIFLVFSPEREDPGNRQYTTRSIPKVIGGCTEACLQAGIKLYSQIIDQVIPVSSTRTAEMIKLLENIHRAINIGLVNEMKIVADRMGIDIHEVIRVAATKPFGFTPYYPGPGLGGHCIPIDPFYLTWKAREYGVHTRFIELAGQINSDMPHWVMGKIMDALNTRQKSIRGSRILILGIAYKKNVDDMRESPAVKLMDMLNERGAHIAYSDPWVPTFPKMRDYYFDMESTEINPEILAGFDLILLTTDHDDFDYPLIQQQAQLIVDTRGVYQGQYQNVIKA